MASRSTHTPRGLSEQPPPAGDWFRELLSPAGIDAVAGIWLLIAAAWLDRAHGQRATTLRSP
jgi:hypothetical protein